VPHLSKIKRAPILGARKKGTAQKKDHPVLTNIQFILLVQEIIEEIFLGNNA
jgi:hypothetical protein